MIPKILHITWVGDDSKCPHEHIGSWKVYHPDWEFRLWNNDKLHRTKWENQRHMMAMAEAGCWNGVADLMRWEILFYHGGVLVDADSWCVQPLPEWIRSCEAWCCSENELARPGLLAAGYVGVEPRNMLMRSCIDRLLDRETVMDDEAWKTVGPQHLTDTWRAIGYANLTVLPSHFFIPKHYAGTEYAANGPVYAKQDWGTTFGTYGKLR